VAGPRPSELVRGNISTDAARTSARIVVRFMLDEGSTDRLRITIKDPSGATIHESDAAVLWRGGDCHPDPVWSKV
jgi:hypothetical protein